MSEPTEKKEKRLFKDQEIYEMFDTSFLPVLQKFVRHAKKTKWEALDIAYFKVEAILLLEDQDEPITYKALKKEEKVLLQITPIEKPRIPPNYDKEPSSRGECLRYEN